MRRPLPSLIRDRRGAIAMSLALLMPVVLGATGLVVEVSSWQAQILKLQRTADAAALCAAQLLNTGSTAQVAATAAANLIEMNGIPAATRSWNAGTNTLTNSYITITLTTGVRSATDQAFKVRISKPATLVLAKLVLSASTVPLAAQAWAELIQSGAATPQPCIVGLAKEATPGTVTGVSISGNSPLNSGNCAVRSNADILVTGGDAVTANAVYSGGNVTVSGGSSLTATNGVFTTADINVSGTSTITGNTASHGNTNLSGNGKIVGTVAAGGNISMLSSTINGNTSATGSTTVDGYSSLNGNAASGSISVPNGFINGNTTSVSAPSVNQWSGHVSGSEGTGADPTAPSSPGTISDPYGSNAAVTAALAKLGSGGTAINQGWAANPVVLQPGTYSSITTADWQTFGNATAVTFAPGTYYVNGNVSLSGYVAGSGVTIVASGTVQIQAGTVSLSAPLATATQGIPGMLLVGKTSTGFTLISSGNTASLAGVMYFPNAPVTITGGVTATAAGCLELIASTVTIGGGSTVGGNCSSFGATSFSATAPVTVVALVQ